MTKLGDPKHKKEISKAFRELEKLGFTVWNFSSNKRLNAGMRDWVDYVVANESNIHFTELKIDKDTFSQGQLETMEILAALANKNKAIHYHIATEVNFRDIIDLIIGMG